MNLLATLAVALCCTAAAESRLLSPSQLSSSCPDACRCQGVAWNCSGLVDLNGELRAADHVRSLTLYNSRVDLEADLGSRFPLLEELHVDGSTCKIQCPQSSMWLLEWPGKLVDAEELACYWPKDLQGTQLPKLLSLMKEVQSQCPGQCLCELVNVPRTTTGLQAQTKTIICK